MCLNTIYITSFTCGARASDGMRQMQASIPIIFVFHGLIISYHFKDIRSIYELQFTCVATIPSLPYYINILFIYVVIV